MALTSMLKDHAMKNLFNTTFNFEALRTDTAIVVRPSKDYPPTSTAFDYLARFWLKKQYPDAETYPWLAEKCVDKLQTWAADDQEFANPLEKAREWLPAAKSEYHTYLDTGELSDDLLRAVFRLAKMDTAFLAGPKAAAGIGIEAPDDAMADLHALWDLMLDGDLAKLRPPMQLNPDFGDASNIVGGAEADIVADGILVDIKTTNKPTFTLEHFRQLAGYATLQRMAGRPDFREVGVYLARYGELLSVGADIIYGALDYDVLRARFRRFAKQRFG